MTTTSTPARTGQDGEADSTSVETTGDIQHLLAIMAQLRHPRHGCPWDREQTFASVAACSIEEAYEVADAIRRGDMCDLRDELGDLLLQVVFHARMAQEQGAFAFADVVDGLRDKLLRRHPHVFAGAPLHDARMQSQAWDAHKRDERAASGATDNSALAGIAAGLPEWLRATKLQQRAARVGFDWPSPAPVLDKLDEELQEVRDEFAKLAIAPEDPRLRQRLEEEIGDLLFVCANLARHARVDVGSALRGANAKFERRFRAMEDLAQAGGESLPALPLDTQDRYWEQAKSMEHADHSLLPG